MDFIFADDARQPKPTRDGMGPLVAIGGLHVPGDKVGSLERSIASLCIEVGFPAGEQFKWSPGKKEPLMKFRLIDEARVNFYGKLISMAAEHGARAFVVMEDSSRGRALWTSESAERDVTVMFLERADWCFASAGKDGVLVIASPSGGTRGEAQFLAHCVATIESGTSYTDLKRIPIGVLFAKSRHVRLLQLADVVTSCTVARFAGEATHCPPVFEMLRPIFRRDGGRIGGVGVKLHPDGRYANLYHWLLGDDFLIKGNAGWPLPIERRSYQFSPDVA
jgi:hypothetical protein